MNIVLADTEEFRKVKRKATKTAPSAPGSAAAAQAMVESEEKRTLGLTIIRGTQIVSCSVESPPPADPAARLGASVPGVPTTMQAGTGISRPAGRGLPIGLSGPVAGVGAPSGFGGFPPGGLPGAPPGFGGRGGPGPAPPGFGPPVAGFGSTPGAPPPFQPPPGFQAPPPQGRGFPPPGFGGR
jgi:small nuclear ribonucleoprotein B and B'